MLEFLKQLDYFIFDLINQKMAVPFLDFFFITVRNSFYLQLIYIAFALFLVYKFRLKSIPYILLFIFCMASSDLISSHLIKPFFHRLRPCMEPSMADHIRRLIPCSSGFSFTSSHAANNMSVATLYAFILPYTFNRFKIAFIGFALLVGYAQIYVGVHYPIDVVSGFLIGTLVGSFYGKCYHYLKLESFGDSKIGKISSES
jgi:undecaprenyl-diphosphatase